MPRRARAKRRKLAASPPSLGAKIVTEDMADASVCSSPSADLISSQIPLVHVEPLDPSVVQKYASASRSRPSAGEIIDQLIYGDINSTSEKVLEQAFKLIGVISSETEERIKRKHNFVLRNIPSHLSAMEGAHVFLQSCGLSFSVAQAKRLRSLSRNAPILVTLFSMIEVDFILSSREMTRDFCRKWRCSVSPDLTPLQRRLNKLKSAKTNTKIMTSTVSLNMSSTTPPAASASHGIVNSVGSSTTFNADLFKHTTTPGINTPLSTPSATPSKPKHVPKSKANPVAVTATRTPNKSSTSIKCFPPQSVNSASNTPTQNVAGSQLPPSPHIEAVRPNMPIFPPFNRPLVPMETLRPPPPNLFPPRPFYQFIPHDNVHTESVSSSDPQFRPGGNTLQYLPRGFPAENKLANNSYQFICPSFPPPSPTPLYPRQNFLMPQNFWQNRMVASGPFAPWATQNWTM